MNELSVMPYLKLAIPPVPVHTKRTLAQQVGSLVVRVLDLPPQHVCRTTVLFDTIADETDLVCELDLPQEVSPIRKRTLIAELSALLLRSLQLPIPRHVDIRLAQPQASF